MKKIFVLFLVIATLTAWINRNNNGPSNYSDYKPVLMERTDLEKSITSEPKRSLKNPGKIYFKDNLIFINEKYEGVHIINNIDPKNPVNTGFIKIPGCIDIAMRYNTLYADNAVDLVAIDITGFPNITIKDREKNIFPEHLPPDQNYLPSIYDEDNRPENTIIIKWEKITN